jgi:hypothetical protein
VKRAPALCPFVGLAPYTLADRDYFFGRERESRLLAANMRSASLCVFYGASGVGKSSVLMAGAIPELEKRPRTAVVVHREWQHANLAERVRDAAHEALARARRSLGEAPELDAYLARAPRGPAPALDVLLAEASAALRGQLLIVFDQFEEYALYHAASADPASFDAQLARAVNRDDIPAGILLSLREDQLATLDRFRARIPNLFTNTIRLEAMDEGAAALAIRGPLEKYGSVFPADRVSLEDALVAEVLAQVGSGRLRIEERGSGMAHAGARSGRVEAPFLQLVMTRLWEEEAEQGSSVLRAATLAALGGASGIVKGHLDRVLAGLTEDQRDLCSRFFDRLVTPSGSKVAYGIDDLARTAEASLAEVAPVIRVLSDKRVLRGVAAAPGEPGGGRVEIFHDVLAGAVLDWQRRFGEARERATVRLQAVRRATAFWGLGVAVLTVVLGSAAFAAWRSRNEAERAAGRAQAEALARQAEAEAAEKKRDAANADVAEATRTLESVRAALEELKVATPQSQANTAQQAIREIDKVLRPRVYFQGVTREHAALAAKLTPLLAQRGYEVPGFEYVKEVPSRTELRYFRDEDEQIAIEAVGILRESGLPGIVLTRVRGFDASNVRPGQLEVWLAPGRPTPPTLELS